MPPHHKDCKCADCETVRLAALLAREFEQAFALPAMRRVHDVLVQQGVNPHTVCFGVRRDAAWQLIRHELAKN